MGSKDVEWNLFTSASSDCKIVNPQPQMPQGTSVPSSIGHGAPVASNMFGTPSWQYQQPALLQLGTNPALCHPITPQQQHWMAAQQKALEDQKKMYEQFIKQKQFDEQKQRLKEFGTYGAKGKVSADSMIENILGKSEKPKSVNRDSASNAATRTLQYSVTEDPPQFLQSYPLQNVVFNHPVVAHPQQTVKGSSPANPNSSNIDLSTESSLNNNSFTTQNPNLLIQKVKQLPLVLPHWLSDSSKVPKFYSLCSELVNSPDGRVDTSKAYPLLLQSSLPPHLLGVLWEMVNRTQPGCLEMNEFWCLLILIALVQNGKSFSTPEIVTDLPEPIFPSISHPGLSSHSPNIKENTQPESSILKPQENVSQSDDEFDDFVSASFSATSSTNIKDQQSHKVEPSPLTFPSSIQTINSGDLFSMNNSKIASPLIPSSSKAELPPPDLNKDPNQLKKMNLPSLGNSPLSLRKSLPNPMDEFDKFQSAAVSITLPIGKSPSTSSIVPDSESSSRIEPIFDKSQSYPTFDNNPEGDRYAVLRELGSFNQEQTEDNDESFGEFASSVPNNENVITDSHSLGMEQNKSKLSNNNVSSMYAGPSIFPLNSNLSEGWAADPFGEFEEGPKLTPALEFSSESSSYVTADASADTSNDADDDFGDFVKPTIVTSSKDTLTPVASATNLVLSELQAETQSVASLELPGLDVTVNLSDEIQGSFGENVSISEGSNKPDATSISLDLHNKLDPPPVSNSLFKPQATSSIEMNFADFSNISHTSQVSNLSNSIKDLSIEGSFELKTKSATLPSLGLPPTSSLPPIGTYSLADKYSSIRSEAIQNEFEDPQSDSWRKCLKGCSQLLEEGLGIVKGIPQADDLLNRVLLTSQMQEYLDNLYEVWLVSKRISISCSKMGTSANIPQLLKENSDVWTSILQFTSGKFDDKNEDTLEENKENSCSLCLVGGGASLSYGGHSYHPPCANLWLNVVDLTLPTLQSTNAMLL